MSQTRSVKNPIYIQDDLSDIKLICEEGSLSVFSAKQTSEDKTGKQTVRVLTDIHNHYALKREKDLLHYLNKFPDDFPKFNEIRKAGFSYLKFFDFVGKKSLKDVVKKKGVLSSEEAKTLLEHMVSALDKVHGVGFVHTRIRPENIIVGKKHYYLVDWGGTIPALPSFETEVLLGDQKYCPPERLNGEYEASGDIYLLGCVLYFALTGKHIYRLNKVEHSFDQLYAHAFHTPRKLNLLPVFWRQLIVWMTQKSPKDRPGLADLQQWLKDESVPKEIRQQKPQNVKGFPEDSLTVLADSHYLYALFKKATLYDASGDAESAFNLYETCAFRGYTRAENNLGLMYEKGKVVRQSYIKAMNMFYQAYEKGNPYGAYNLGYIFEKGWGVDVNLPKAYQLYKYAAMRGHLAAQNRLGECYLDGRGVEVDVVQARFWFGMAAHYGNEVASQNIRRLLMENRRAV